MAISYAGAYQALHRSRLAPFDEFNDAVTVVLACDGILRARTPC